MDIGTVSVVVSHLLAVIVGFGIGVWGQKRRTRYFKNLESSRIQTLSTQELESTGAQINTVLLGCMERLESTRTMIVSAEKE